MGTDDASQCSSDTAAVSSPIESDASEQILLDEPFYVPINDEVEIFEAAFQQRTPVLLKGPTGCGKTRFVEYVSWRIGQKWMDRPWPLVVVTCHEDLTGSDLVGRYLLTSGETVWRDGPVTRAARRGALCYLDEIVEARRDTTALIHSLTDHRRYLALEKLNSVVQAASDFMMVVSYNPGYQSMLKEMKRSTRQRFISIDFDYPPLETEAQVVQAEASVDAETAHRLALVGQKLRNMGDVPQFDPPSTRLLIFAAQLIVQGVDVDRACRTAIIGPATDDAVASKAAAEVVRSVFG